MRPQFLTVAAVICTALATAACGQIHHPGHAAAAAPVEAGAMDLQGDPRAFVDNRHVRAFYVLSKETLGKGTKGVDVAAYEQQSYAIFRAFGAERGPSAEGMQDHLKLIPRQVVKIVEEDPRVLDSFDSFTEALIGPK